MYDKFPNVLETVSCRDFTQNSVIFEDGTEERIDAIILCTGFKYDFPFLTPECRTLVERGRVSPLYRHLVHCELHSLVFVGLLNTVPFLSATPDPQIQYYKAVLDGKTKLPSVEEMKEDEEKDYQSRLSSGFLPHKAHTMVQRLWPYVDALAKDGGFPTYKPHFPEMYKDNVTALVTIPYEFRTFLDKKIKADQEKQQNKLQEQRKESAERAESHAG